MAEAKPDKPEEKEIVIIRRRGGGDGDGHHGGVWKIAFADFMTAMMAFFLVLWLVNSTNKETKASIARYFNPIQFSDIAPRRGLQDAQEGGTGGTSTDNVKADKKPAPGETSGPIPGTRKSASYSEGALFRDPYGVLSEIAGGGPGQGASTPTPNPEGAGKARGEDGLNGGDSYRDPFAPATRSAVAPPADPIRPIFPPSAQTPPPAPSKRDAAATESTPGLTPAPPAAGTSNASTAKGGGGGKADSAKADEARKEPSPQIADAIEAPKLGAELEKALKEVVGNQAGPKIEVVVTSEGLLISLTDEADFGMFASGSAEPDRKVVKLMEKVAQSVKTRPGAIVIRGHTDSRPFRSANYDNWRLSSARAHMAQYMLVRGGVDEKRIERIEGYAERRPRLTSSPEAAENRRIEILLRRDKS